MQEFISRESDEYKELIGKIDKARTSVRVVHENRRPTIADEIYLSGDEVMKYLHISQRTLQTLRDNNVIVYTTIGGKILYPESELQSALSENIHSTIISKQRKTPY